MKNIIVIAVFIFLNSSSILNAQLLIISTKYSDSDTLYNSEGEVRWFSKILASKVEEEFKCLTVKTEFEIGEEIKYSRWATLAGNNSIWEQTLNGLKDGWQFVIELTVTRIGNKFIFYANCLSIVEANAIAKISRQITGKPGSKEFFDMANSMSDQIVRELAYFEPCFYGGEITLKADELSTEDDTTKSFADCGDHTGLSTKVHKEMVITEDTWKMTKESRIKASGTLEWNVKSYVTVIDSNERYPCSSGKPGLRRSEKNYDGVFKGSGVPQDIKVNSDPYFSVSTRLRFQKDSTYTLIFHSSGKWVTSDVEVKNHVTGCDPGETIKPSKETKNVYIDIALGPFQGSPFDKVLHETGTQKIKNSINNSGTYQYSFTLRRK